jgi:carnitine monooxygenase subunit
MDKTLELECTERVLELVRNRTSDLAPTPYDIPVDVYLDEERAHRERERLFRSLPLLAALSCELRNPGDFKAIEIMDVPILLMRDRDGQVGAYLNACRHRGMKLTEGHGTSTRLRCPYHAWTYDNQGNLTNVPFGPESFPGLCLEEKGLVAVPCQERHGIIWVKLDRDDGPLDVDEFLGEMGDDLATWDIGSWHFVNSKPLGANANWKLTAEGYLENYHVGALHAESLAQIAKSYYGCARTPFGDHQRLVYANHMIDTLVDIPKEEWVSFDTGAISFIYHVFPATMMVMFFDHFEVFQIFPGKTPGTSTTIQNLYTATELVEYDEKKAMQERFDFVYMLVEAEDYWAAASTQAALLSGANDTLVFGRQEIALHHLHDTCFKHLQPAFEPA